jgi:hypothetical protein
MDSGLDYLVLGDHLLRKQPSAYSWLSHGGLSARYRRDFRESTEPRDGFSGLIVEFCSAKLIVFYTTMFVYLLISVSEAIRLCG